MMTEQEIKSLFQQADDLSQQGKLDEAAAAYRNIKREDSPKVYAKAQFNLGIALVKQGNTEGAIAAFRNIKHEDSPEQYAKAQVNLGVILGEQGDTKGEIAAYRNVGHEDSPEQYAKAQVNLGIVLGKQGNTEGAIAAYRNIKREDSPKVYAIAQVNLGVILGEQGDTKGEIAAYRNVEHEDSPEQYAIAQLNLGIALGEQGDNEGEIAAYRNIQPEDSQEVYAMAQMSLGDVWVKQNKTENAIAAFRNITYQGLEHTKAYKKYCYQLESRIKIAKCTLNHAAKLVKIPDFIEKLILKLLVSKDKNSNEKDKSQTESKVAHYTRPSTAQAVINTDSPSPFRLSTIKGVNDPTEGLALYRYIGKYCNLLSALTIEPADASLAVFISCFTFNHDSLNQFRLYGKEDGREASGVSLVFKDSFFSSENPFGMLSTHSNALIQNLSNENPTIKSDPQTESAHTETHFLPKLPLFRCIYLDPQSGYLALAHRDKATFYAESWHGNKTADHKTVCTTANEEWEVYQDKISTLTEEVKTALSELVEMIKDAAEGAENNVLEALAFILQPLRYLVKHAAFQEEQECRMLYICDLINDNRIRADWNNRQMYIEYEPLVRDSLDKIYLSPGAEPYADFFKRSLPDLARSGKIRRSQNPFRNK